MSEGGAEQSLEQIQQRIIKLEESLVGKSVKFDSAREEVLLIERQLHKARQSNEELHVKLSTKTNEINQLRAKRERLQELSKDSREAIRKTLIAQYSLWRQPKLKVLLDATSAASMRRNLKYYDYIASANLAFLRDHTQAIAGADTLEVALKLETQKLNLMQQETSNHLRVLRQTLEQQTRATKTLENILSTNKKALNVLQNDESELLELVKDVVEPVNGQTTRNTPFEKLKGELAWPTAGSIAKAPGSAMRAGGAKWSGVIIDSKRGSKVNAIATGRIAFADWFRNLGLLLIIDHGDGYMSLYGHNEELYKRTGDWVNVGDTVAIVGATGGKSAAGLYFEIREGGKPQDPRQWCKK